MAFFAVLARRFSNSVAFAFVAPLALAAASDQQLADYFRLAVEMPLVEDAQPTWQPCGPIPCELGQNRLREVERPTATQIERLPAGIEDVILGAAELVQQTALDFNDWQALIACAERLGFESPDSGQRVQLPTEKPSQESSPVDMPIPSSCPAELNHLLGSRAPTHSINLETWQRQFLVGSSRLGQLGNHELTRVSRLVDRAHLHLTHPAVPATSLDDPLPANTVGWIFDSLQAVSKSVATRAIRFHSLSHKVLCHLQARTWTRCCECFTELAKLPVGVSRFAHLPNRRVYEY